MCRNSPTNARALSDFYKFILKQAHNGISPWPVHCLREMYRNNLSMLDKVDKYVFREMLWELRLQKRQFDSGEQSDFPSIHSLVELLRTFVECNAEPYHRTQRILIDLLMAPAYQPGDRILYDATSQHSTAKGWKLGSVKQEIDIDKYIVCDADGEVVRRKKGDGTGRPPRPRHLLSAKMCPAPPEGCDHGKVHMRRYIDDFMLETRSDTGRLKVNVGVPRAMEGKAKGGRKAKWVDLEHLCDDGGNGYLRQVDYLRAWLELLEALCLSSPQVGRKLTERNPGMPERCPESGNFEAPCKSAACTFNPVLDAEAMQHTAERVSSGTSGGHHPPLVALYSAYLSLYVLLSSFEGADKGPAQSSAVAATIRLWGDVAGQPVAPGERAGAPQQRAVGEQPFGEVLRTCHAKLIEVARTRGGAVFSDEGLARQMLNYLRVTYEGVRAEDCLSRPEVAWQLVKLLRSNSAKGGASAQLSPQGIHTVFECRMMTIRILGHLVDSYIRKIIDQQILPHFKAEHHGARHYNVSRQVWKDAGMERQVLPNQAIGLSPTEFASMLKYLLDVLDFARRERERGNENPELLELREQALKFAFKVCSVPRTTVRVISRIVILKEQALDTLQEMRALVSQAEVVQAMNDADDTKELRTLLSKLCDLCGGDQWRTLDRGAVQRRMKAVGAHSLALRVVSQIPASRLPMRAAPSAGTGGAAVDKDAKRYRELANACFVILRRYVDDNDKHQNEIFPHIQGLAERFLGRRGIRQLSPLLTAMIGARAHRALRLLQVYPGLLGRIIKQGCTSQQPSGGRGPGAARWPRGLRPRFVRFLHSLTLEGCNPEGVFCAGEPVRHNLRLVAKFTVKRHGEIFPPLLSCTPPAAQGREADHMSHSWPEDQPLYGLRAVIDQGNYWSHPRGIMRYHCAFVALVAVFPRVQGVPSVVHFPEAYYAIVGVKLHLHPDAFDRREKIKEVRKRGDYFPLYFQSPYIAVITGLLLGGRCPEMRKADVAGDVVESLLWSMEHIEDVQCRHRHIAPAVCDDALLSGDDSSDAESAEADAEAAVSGTRRGDQASRAALQEERARFLLDACCPFLVAWQEQSAARLLERDAVDAVAEERRAAHRRAAAEWVEGVCNLVTVDGRDYLGRDTRLCIRVEDLNEDRLENLRSFLEKMPLVLDKHGAAEEIRAYAEGKIRETQEARDSSLWVCFDKYVENFCDQVSRTTDRAMLKDLPHGHPQFQEFTRNLRDALRKDRSGRSDSDPWHVQSIAQMLRDGAQETCLDKELLGDIIAFMDALLGSVSEPRGAEGGQAKRGERAVVRKAQNIMDTYGVTVSALRIYELWSKDHAPGVIGLAGAGGSATRTRARDVSTLDLLKHLLKYGNKNVQRNVYMELSKRSYPTVFVVIRDQFRMFAESLKNHHTETSRCLYSGHSRQDTLARAEKESEDDYDAMMDLLSFIQLMCEGHNTHLQNFLREQKGKLFSVNVVKETCLFMQTWFQYVLPFPGCMNIGIQCLRTLTELCQGPCEGNQLCLVESGIADTAIRIIARGWEDPSLEDIFEAVYPDHDPFLVTALEATAMMLSLTEGVSASSQVPGLLLGQLAGQVSSRLLGEKRQSVRAIEDVLLDRMNEAWMLGWVAVADRGLQGGPGGGGAGRQGGQQASPAEVFDSDANIRLGESVFIFLLCLCRVQEVREQSQHTQTRNAVHSVGRPLLRQRMRKQCSHDFFNSRVGCVEIRRLDGDKAHFEWVYFPIPLRCRFPHGLPEVAKAHFNENVSRRIRHLDEEDAGKHQGRQDDKKIQYFFRRRESLIVETETYYHASKHPLSRFFIQHRAPLRLVSVSFSLALSAFLLLTMTRLQPRSRSYLSPEWYDVFLGLAWVQAAFEAFLFVGWVAVDGRVLLNDSVYEATKRWQSQKQAEGVRAVDAVVAQAAASVGDAGQEDAAEEGDGGAALAFPGSERCVRCRTSVTPKKHFRRGGRQLAKRWASWGWLGGKALARVANPWTLAAERQLCLECYEAEVFYGESADKEVEGCNPGRRWKLFRKGLMRRRQSVHTRWVEKTKKDWGGAGDDADDDGQQQQLTWLETGLMVGEVWARNWAFWTSVFFAAAAPLGIAVHPVFFSAQIFRITESNVNVRNVVRAVTDKWWDLMQSATMGVLIVYLFSMLSFFYFSSKYYDYHVNPELGRGFHCQTLSRCFAVNLFYGLRMDGGISDLMQQPWPHEPSYWSRITWDFFFWAIMIVIFLNIIFGIILDTFKELRQHKQEIEADMRTSCFICGKEAGAFDKIKDVRFPEDPRRGFVIHYRDQHNQWMYLSFLHYLALKDPTEFNGQEQYVSDKVQREKTDWIPDNCVELIESELFLDRNVLDEQRDESVAAMLDTIAVQKWCERELRRRSMRAAAFDAARQRASEAAQELAAGRCAPALRPPAPPQRGGLRAAAGARVRRKASASGRRARAEPGGGVRGARFDHGLAEARALLTELRELLRPP
eukprot:TRINITY_DN8612_c0_g1_i1.p1 TRINITY_DN8612_c0_g1~~TRINITY_DN8612_c0_g1_i1.p1  ORF type:complete len:2470 (+),score=1002.42 TRINITY_DN8612_c0_g1_i1:797-8206(+)